MGNSSSSSSPSSSRGGGKGGNWTHKIYFNPEADKEKGDSYFIEVEKLIENLATLVDPDEEILKVYAYKQKLSNWNITSFSLYHMLIVFETEKWWWSIEKNSEGITIQRSIHLSAVKDKHRQKDRVCSVYLVKEAAGKNSVKALIDWLYKEDELNKNYHYFYSNCKTFAMRVFGHVARNEYLHWYHGFFTWA